MLLLNCGTSCRTILEHKHLLINSKFNKLMEWQLVPLQCLLLVLIFFSRIDIAWILPYCCLFALYAFQFNLCFILVLSYFCMNTVTYVLKVHEYFMCVLSWFAYLLNYRLLIICMSVLVCVICAINVGIYFLYWLLVLWL